MIRARIATGTAVVVALAGCSHPGAPIAPPPAPIPASLDVAVTDAPDSIAAWISDRGAYRVSARTGDTVQLESVAADAAPSLVLHRVPARGARDAIDAGVDVLLTADPDAIAYAARRSDLTSLPSEWNRTYVLLVRGVASDSVFASRRDTLRAELATDAVRVDARPAPVAAGADSCGVVDFAAPGPTRPGGPSNPRIVYPRSDDVARALAERLVALGSSRAGLLASLSPALARAGDSLRAEGMDAREAVRAVQSGAALAAVLAVPAAERGCGVDDGSAGTGAVTIGIALIQTRERLIVRRSLTGPALAGLVRAVGDSSPAGP